VVSGSVEEFFCPFHLQIETSSTDDLGEELLMQKVTESSQKALVLLHLLYYLCRFLADRTAARSVIGYCQDTVVYLIKCIVAKRYILQQKCSNSLVGSAPKEHNFTVFNPLHRPWALKLSTTKISAIYIFTAPMTWIWKSMLLLLSVKPKCLHPTILSVM